MINDFPQSQNTNPDLKLEGFKRALHGICNEAICEASRMFLSGSVADHNRAFAPSCAEFSVVARKEHERIMRVKDYEMRKATPRIAPPQKIKKTPEQIARAQEILRQFHENLAKNKTVESE